MKKLYNYWKIILIVFTLNNTNAQQFLNAENGTTNLVETMTPFANGASSLSDIMVVDNPSPSGINTSLKVVRYLRRTGGPGAEFFAGFFAGIVDPDPNFTVNKYMHVKVYKQKVSPVRFKIEGGPAGNIEVGSTQPYATSNTWQDMVFDFTTATGSYPTIVFFPDFEDPLTNTGDIYIYFDDIELNNISTPFLSNSTFDSLSNSVTIYPNPSQSEINIESSISLNSLYIYDSLGRIVLSKNETFTKNTININNLQNGLYWIKVFDFEGNTIVKSVLKN